jgi:hypothetical protein
VWERVRPATIAGGAALVLAPADLVLHLCLHAEHHQFDVGLRLLCDLGAVLARYGGDLDWEGLRASAREAQAEGCVFLALGLARTLAQAPVPPGVLKALEPPSGAPSLALARAALLAGEPEPVPDREEVLFPLRVFAQISAPRWWGRSLKSGLRFVFPPRAYMRDYMANVHALPLTPLRNYTSYGTRWLDWLGRAGRMLGHAICHPQATADFLQRRIRDRRLRASLGGPVASPRPSRRRVS